MRNYYKFFVVFAITDYYLKFHPEIFEKHSRLFSGVKRTKIETGDKIIKFKKKKLNGLE